MQSNIILTIGHGARTFSSFLQLLKKYEVSMLIDIRSNPYSRFHPSYNRKQLTQLLEAETIGYSYKGVELGGKPKDARFYEDGSVNYKLIEAEESYRIAIDELMGLSRLQNICLLCAELKPAACHRKSLVGQSLFDKSIRVLHIDEKGDLNEHASSPSLLLF